ncbi:TraR/DksA C4-type zinc finger protein [Phytopseudomonas seleniipraecipitans]|uniref:Transcriptional regulator, TraR/DksA family n=1 Tax=Phytopseudomonas seleniipraecipitans TaxID=640205 RepID=A0A1G7JDS3_9GAMM|nr:TraR/DksA C4-type zinc finger protein [Pseudomonas seleniipraecipitans]SDF23033.1 transcriptional regulator, TraR/DksA family [Pseudomonas seleniipraecipitans]
MADDLDLASEREEQMRAGAILALQRKQAPAYTISAEYCDDCGVAIPAARRLAVPGCERCVYCQARREVRRA